MDIDSTRRNTKLLDGWLTQDIVELKIKEIAS
jgi:hypothetical protein